MNAIEITQSSIRHEILAEEAYHCVEEELLALPADKVLTVNLEIPVATSTAIGRIPKLISLKGQLAEELRTFDVGVIDKLEGYSYAVLYAHSAYQCETRTPADLQELLDSGIRIREVLHSDAKALICRELLSPESIRDFDGLIGYLNVANDLQMLCTALGSHWQKIEGRCGTTKEELDFASRLAGRIVRLAGQREASTAKVEEAADKRSRAFTLFFQCYDEIQRGVGYVRWHAGDADEYAPSLHATSHKSARGSKGAKNAAPAEPTPAQPSNATTPTPTPVNQSFNSPSPFMPAGSAAPARQGVPGGNPYMQ